jgi:hypothetical protein
VNRWSHLGAFSHWGEFIDELGFFYVGSFLWPSFVQDTLERKLCEGGPCSWVEKLFLGGPAWINLVKRRSVFLYSTYPCPMESKRNGGGKAGGKHVSCHAKLVVMVKSSVLATSQCPMGQFQ